MQFGVAGVFEILLTLLLGSGSMPLGMPPGERDATLLATAPQDSIAYMEWASIGEGKPGAPGPDGFVADPEVKAFVSKLQSEIVSAIRENSEDEDYATQTFGKHVAPLVIKLFGRPGCVFLRVNDPVLKQKLEQSLDGNYAMLFEALQGAIVISGGDEADAIAEHLEALTSLLPAEARSKTPLDRQVLPIPGGPQVLLHRSDSYFVLALGEPSLERVLTGLKGEGDSLADQPRFTEAVQKVLSPRPGMIVWYDLGQVRSQARTVADGLMGGNGGAAMVDGVLEMLGLSKLELYVASTGIEDGASMTRTFIQTGGGTDRALSLFAGRGLKPDDFKMIPADADMVLGLSVNWKQVLESFRTILGAADAPSLEAFNNDVKAVEEALGVPINDLFDAFGEVWTLHNSPQQGGGVLFGNLVATVEVKKPQEAYAHFQNLMTTLRDSLPPENDNDFRRRVLVLGNRKFMGRTIYFLNPIGYGGEIFVAPSFCITEGHLVAALTPQALKAYLRDQENPGETYASKLKTELTGEDVFLFADIDSKEGAKIMYAFLPYFGTAIFSELQGFMRDFGISVYDLPSARAVLPYTGRGKAKYRRTDNGILMEDKSGLPFPGMWAVQFQVFAVFGTRAF